ncbi:drug resistance transporter, EmrB/QacA subfamily [Frankia torreyi]|uniref:Drug resistance transporter, EmrB/QacA subfamily n=3 Tax=Frankia TaxID=1854 RepID=A0A0D8BND8_9ACTN|nr:drug resistance transporter, EmrB/QacA subfamily [Frankia torreyi]
MAHSEGTGASGVGGPDQVAAGVPGGTASVEASVGGGRGAAGSAPPAPRAKWAVLAVCCLAQFMVVLDISIVNVALPAMQTDLGMSAGGLQWVVNAYTLAFAGLLLFGGRAADLFGRRRVFVFGLGLFTLASLAGGLAQSETQLIIARAVQGLGGAVLAPATLSLLMTSFAEGRERTRALGAWGATAASGGAFGTVVGGILTDVADWRWVLFVNVPIGVALVAAARVVLVESRGQVSRLRDLDAPGTLTVTGGLVLLVYAIVRTETSSWGSPVTIGLLVGAVVLLGAFVAIEATTANPLVPLNIFRYPGIAVANVVAALLGAAMFAVFFFLTLFLQRVEDYSPLRAGLSMLPMPLMIILASQLVTRTIGRLGPRPIIIFGAAVGSSGLLWLSAITVGGSYWTHVFGPLAVMGFGMGTTMVSMVSAATAGVPMRLAGLASGLINTGRQIGAAVGLAAVTTIATHHTDSRLRHGIAPPEALTSGYSLGLFISGCVFAVGVPVAFLLPRLRRPEPAAAGPPAPAQLADAQLADADEQAVAHTAEI